MFWTTRSLRNLESELQPLGYQISYRTVGTLLGELRYSLQLNRKNLQVGKSHPNRNEQFMYINARALEYMELGEPVISIDVKKKENIGNFIGRGAEYVLKGNPVELLDHDFPIPENGKAVLYGVYDLKANESFVHAGISADTVEFATASINHWWNQVGKERYPKATKRIITAEGGGRNGYRVRL